MQIDLTDKVAVVTGGSRGIGAATVKLLAAAGAGVAFSYRQNVRAAKAVEKAVAAAGGKALAVRADVSKMADAKQLVDSAARLSHGLDHGKKSGRIDILVANAGIWNAEPAPIEKMTERQWDQMIAINLKGVYTVVRQATPLMIRQKSGRIIVVSSTAGQRGEAFHTHYGASKGGVISLVKGLSTELAPHNILVNCVAPGWVDTDMCLAVTTDPEELGKVSGGIPLRRLARPEEIAMPILFLASEMAS